MLQQAEYDLMIHKLNSLLPSIDKDENDANSEKSEILTVTNAINYIKYLKLLLSECS